MSERVTNQYLVSMNTMDGSITEEGLSNVAKALIAWVKYSSQKKNWEYKLLAVGSMVDSYATKKMKERTNKKGRPKTIFISNGKPLNEIVTPHLHMLIQCNPGETMMQELEKYWNKKFNKEELFEMVFKRERVYSTKGCFKYMDKQSAFNRNSSYPKGAINDWEYICLQKRNNKKQWKCKHLKVC